ncbi:MAG: Trk system potassium transporter TrkA [Pirellulales bacterium]
MNIAILGAGRVGFSIADLLCRMEHSVTVVDNDPERVAKINEELDVRAIVGSAAESVTLIQAEVGSADICLAMTGKDEINIIAASMAKRMGVPRVVARIYAPVFRDLSSFDYLRHFGIDRMLSLEHLTAMELARGIREPGSVVVEQFARGGLEVQEFIVGQEGKLTRNTLRDIGISSNVRVGTIQREKRIWIASADDQLCIGDKVTVFCRPEDMKSVRALFKTGTSQTRRIVIAGGGETGFHLARTLERESFKVTIIEQDERRCIALANMLESTSVINAIATDPETLEEQRVGNADIFVACTGDDEDNLVMAVKSNELGAKKVMCTIGRADYASVTKRLGIDVAVSSRDVMAKQISSYLHQGIVISRVKMEGGLINVIEVDVMEGSPATKSILAEIGIPERCLIVAVIQLDYVRVPGAKDRLTANDTVILIVEDDVVESTLSIFSV